METSLLRAPSGRLRTPWRLLLGAVVLVLLSVAGTLAFLAVDRLFFGFGGTLVLVGSAAASGVGLAVGVAVAARFLDRRSPVGLGLAFDPGWRRDLAVGVVLGGGLLTGPYLVGVAIGVYRPRLAPAAPEGLSVVAGFALVTGLMCLVGVYEELLFRGYLMTNLAEGLTAVLETRTAVLGAVVLSGLGFAAVHGSNPNMNALGVGTIAVAGVAFGLGYALTGRIALPVGFHAAWNLAHFVFGLPVSGLDLGIRLLATDRAGPALLHGGAVGFEGGLLGLAGAIVGCLAVLAYGRRFGGGFRTDIGAPPPRRDGG
jgi:membrane protease YdiL (CAAX protease family)